MFYCFFKELYLQARCLWSTSFPPSCCKTRLSLPSGKMTATATGVLRHHCWSSLVMLFLNVNWERLQSRQNPKKIQQKQKKNKKHHRKKILAFERLLYRFSKECSPWPSSWTQIRSHELSPVTSNIKQWSLPGPGGIRWNMESVFGSPSWCQRTRDLLHTIYLLHSDYN